VHQRAYVNWMVQNIKEHMAPGERVSVVRWFETSRGLI
jgi:hypothetical protein